MSSMSGSTTHRHHRRLEISRRLVDGHCRQSLNLGTCRDDAHSTSGPTQLSCDLAGPFQVLAAVRQDHHIATGLLSGRCELLDRDVAVGREHRHAPQ